jgi:hypothetical protein
LLKRFLYYKNSRRSIYRSEEDFVLVLKNVIADFIAHIQKFKLFLGVQPLQTPGKAAGKNQDFLFFFVPLILFQVSIHSGTDGVCCGL